MKRSQIRQLVFLVAICALALGLAAGWLLSETFAGAAGQAPWRWLVAVVLGGAAVAGAYGLWRFMRAYTRQVQELAQAGRTMLATGAPYTASPDAHADVAELAAVFNRFSARFDSLQQAQAEAVRHANAALAEERNLLAALMSELSEGVLVCNHEGQILLYNRSAASLLAPGTEGEGGGYIGLGRSIFAVLDRNTVAHAVDQVDDRRTRTAAEAAEVSSPVTSFVTAATNGRLLRIRLTAFRGAEGRAAGFVLALQDLSEGIERSLRRDALLQTLTERTRASLGAIRAAIEAIEQFPAMMPAQRSRLQAAIHDEAQRLSEQLSSTLQENASHLRAQWRLEEMQASDLLWTIRRHLARKMAIDAEVAEASEGAGGHLWLKIDSYAIVDGFTQLLTQLKHDFDIRVVRLRLQPEGSFAALDLAWDTGGHDAATWQAWKDQALTVDEGDGVLSLREVAERHGGEVWFQLQGAEAYFRLLLPQALTQPEPAWLSAPSAAAPQPALTSDSRPEYYDFDLFHRPGQRPELDQRSLRELAYTVFDTETTGLLPERDEIVSIGALRIVNGRLLRQELFEQLVDPRCPIPSAASDVHGITDAMVAGQPSIGTVLPRFHQFAADTVLVGHNLAFDLRMFQAKEAVTGIVFDAPVLDTLLLSAVVHPEAESYSLEAIAGRLGIVPLGRHTALGDALMAGEIFLRLIPLLAAQGIDTLAAARQAAEQTYFARLRY